MTNAAFSWSKKRTTNLGSSVSPVKIQKFYFLYSGKLA